MARPDTSEVNPESALLVLRALSADLHRQRQTAATQLRELAEQRRSLALTALTDKAAKRKLTEVSASSAAVALTIENLGMASDELDAEIGKAEAAVEAEEARARARHIATVLVKRFRQAGEKCGRGLDDFAAGFAEILETANQISRHGGTLNREIVRVNVARSVQARLFLMGRLNSEPLPRAAVTIPTVEALIEKFAETVSARAVSVITGESAPVAVAVDDVDDGPDYPRIPGEEYLEPDPVDPVEGDPEIGAEEAA
jgi:hypothetical protein